MYVLIIIIFKTLACFVVVVIATRMYYSYQNIENKLNIIISLIRN